MGPDTGLQMPIVLGPNLGQTQLQTWQHTKGVACHGSLLVVSLLPPPG